jgi:hypothetical protein
MLTLKLMTVASYLLIISSSSRIVPPIVTQLEVFYVLLRAIEIFLGYLETMYLIL